MLSVVILTAGQGTRMKSGLPKGLHEVAGVPMLGHVIARAQELKAERESEEIVIVTGHGADQIEAFYGSAGVLFARQDRQLGTAHAFLCARDALAGRSGDIVVLYGDTPLVRRETLEAALAFHRTQHAGMTVITGVMEDATGYGRIVHDANGDVIRIVEQKSATPEEQRIREWNSGMYIFDSSAFELAQQIGNNNRAGEYYLTDILELYRKAGKRVQAFVGDSAELHGVNDRVQLAAAERVMRDRVRDRLMRSGVTLRDPDTTFVDSSVQVEPDVILEPGVVICGKSFVGRGSVIGAYSVIRDSRLEGAVKVKSHSVLEGAIVHGGADVGPFARLRPGAILERDVHIGNFVEIKNSVLLEGAKAGHLAYIGDAEVGRDVNFSAGAITANYDGVHKHRTVIADGAFVGTNVTLVAPVTLEEGAFVAAGSTITTNLPEGALGVTRAPQKTVENWSQKYWTRKLEGAKPGKLPVIQRWLERRKTKV
jgi:bifunctional UDP-N-acetylglucosamine pyrophosphorylase / glucosamine-1-phosphate N-acetyltransferase